MDPHHSPGFVALVDAAKQRIQEISVVQVRDRQLQGEPFYLIDVREESEWQAGHIVGAMHLGRGILERDLEQRIPDRTADIVLYCGGGYRSALAADNLQQMGYSQVRSMAGGIREWRAVGYPEAQD
ncbi:MAG: sulfurtransferase [Synechococcaceae cyanobacterium SM2_3_1]|nr:sulfurtransferase [Synechococcaceae cyanobacterium SM2_3_1]